MKSKDLILDHVFLLEKFCLQDVLTIIQEIESEDHFFWNREKLRSEFQRSDFYGVKHQGEIVNTMALTSLADGFEIPFLYCRKKFRRSGWTQALLKTVIDAKCQFLPVWLEVAEGNQSALRLYTRLGFVYQRTRSNYYSNGESALCLEKSPGKMRGE